MGKQLFPIQILLYPISWIGKCLSNFKKHLNYIQSCSFLAYSDLSIESRNNIQDLLKANVQVDTLHHAVNVIHLSDDLPVSASITVDNEEEIMESDDVSLNTTNINGNYGKSLEYLFSTSKWQRIKGRKIRCGLHWIFNNLVFCRYFSISELSFWSATSSN